MLKIVSGELSLVIENFHLAKFDEIMIVIRMLYLRRLYVELRASDKTKLSYAKSRYHK